VSSYLVFWVFFVAGVLRAVSQRYRRRHGPEQTVMHVRQHLDIQQSAGEGNSRR
jgi:hypothetical protein